MNAIKLSVPTLVAALPGGEVFDTLYDRELFSALTESGFSCLRPSLRLDSREHLGKLHATLRSAAVVLADVTARNPSVMYAAGVAHAVGKSVILCALNAEDVAVIDPIAESQPLIHSGSPEILKRLLTARLKSLWGERSPEASSPGDPTTGARDPLQEFHRLFGEILGTGGSRQLGRVRAEGATTFVLEGQELELAMVQELSRRARALGIRLKLL